MGHTGADVAAVKRPRGVPLLLVSVAALIAGPALAGDFCIVVCDRTEQARNMRTCPSPHVRTSEQMRADLRHYANGERVEWPPAALMNGFVSFCSPAVHQAVMASVVENIPVAAVDRRRQLVDFACMAGPARALASIETALARPKLTPAQRDRLSRARATLRSCTKPRSN